jgi:hypothetical protein
MTRALWTDVDHILLVYVGSAAEFALVEENHWLFYTNKLPSAPLDRLVSTLMWNRKVMQVPEEEALALARTIRGFHDLVEKERSHEEGGKPKISNQAFRAVGAMLIDYALLAEDYLSRKPLPDSDREIYYQDQRRFFEAMGITGWEPTLEAYEAARREEEDALLKPNAHTRNLFAAYRQDLGWCRYQLLICFMGHFLPESIREKLQLKRHIWFTPAYRLYPFLHGTVFARVMRWFLLPQRVRTALG